MKHIFNVLSGIRNRVHCHFLRRSPGNHHAAAVSASKLLIDGKEVALTAYTIDGNNYFKLRDIGQAFDFGIGWDNASKTITIDTSAGYTA